jgi:hypothetical protein
MAALFGSYHWITGWEVRRPGRAPEWYGTRKAALAAHPDLQDAPAPHTWNTANARKGV